MSVTIIPLIEYEQYMVNGYLVYKDALRNWACKHDLSANEHEAFKIYEKMIINESISKIKGSYICEFTNLKFTIKHIDDYSLNKISI
ncbi:hypothetical protein OA93_23045 [Flavobacterium sp. KMS]|uniref:hypothetical protein n=1 Tax=Flavobacterium sp. KMS TaxID=1566023 RepID=UPI0005805E66|nr:hypothetical protein [Flavobacterium sp. KMS]KIA92682.1 hypothetical protein OA93_23045 [Flavobacterium sp. KMS]